jgi:nickel transport protein
MRGGRGTAAGGAPHAAARGGAGSATSGFQAAGRSREVRVQPAEAAAGARRTAASPTGGAKPKGPGAPPGAGPHPARAPRAARAATLAALFFLSWLATPAAAHDVRHSVTAGEAVVIELFYAEGTPFTYESYEIYREGEEAPVQVGRTDHLGRIAFLPDRAGRWRVKAFSEDGHGLDFTLETDERQILREEEKPLYERYQRIAVGLAVILGLFGLLMLVYRRRAA